MPDVNEIDLAALRAKAEAATPGPWKALTTGARGGDHWYVCDDGEALAYISANDGSDEEQREPNARYIAAVSPDVVLALVDRIERARDWIEENRPIQCGIGVQADAVSARPLLDILTGAADA